MARTDKGRQIVEGAIETSYLEAKRAEPWKLEKSQKGLLAKKCSIWGRRLACRLLGVPVTRIFGGGLFHAWKSLPWLEKIKSILGTLRRIVQRRYWKRDSRSLIADQ